MYTCLTLSNKLITKQIDDNDLLLYFFIFKYQTEISLKTNSFHLVVCCSGKLSL